MITRKHFLTFLITSAMTLALVTTGSLVEGKGKPGGGGGGGGGGEDPPPPVLYALHRFVMPDGYSRGHLRLLGMNDVGEVVGNYNDDFYWINSQPFYLDAYSGNTVATNLNDLQYDEFFSVPDGWYITRAQGINNLGDIAGGLALSSDPDQIRGCVIELRPDTTVENPNPKPRIHLIPDSEWLRTYARHINDVGVVLGRGTPETAYVFQASLHGQTGDSSVTVIPTAFDAWSQGHLTNPINGGPTLVKASLDLSGEILTYDVDAGTSSFTGVSSLGIGDIRGFNDSGSFCGFYDITKGKNKGRYGYVSDGDFNSLDDMRFSNGVNNSGDVVGTSQALQPILNHPILGSILLDDVLVAANETEKTIWDNRGPNRTIEILTERDETGFPAMAGTMQRTDSPDSESWDGYVLFPIPAQ